MDRNVSKRKRRMIQPDKLVFVVFILAAFFYCGSKIGLKSYNMTLQMQEQKLAREVNEKQQEVDNLKSEVNSLQDKTRVLGMLDNQVSDNQNNIYIMD